LVPAIATLLLLGVGRIFYSDFGLFYQVPQNSGSLYSVTNTIDTYVYRALVSAGGIGRSAAAGVFQSIVGFILVMTSNLIVRKVSSENALF
jgi:putative aldouronate transport system permease protein